MLAGHFPGNPIVPGAWLLAWIVAGANEHLRNQNDDRRVTGARRVKFLRPLAPGQPAECEFVATADALRFTLTHDSDVIASGALTLQSTV